MKLDLLLAADVDSALTLSTQEGWNQTAADWDRLIALEPQGCFAARDGSRLVGTVTTTTYEGALAWIGMMIVHPEYRRRGIGADLMRCALDHLQRRGIPSAKLDATPAGRPLCESLGFGAESDWERWQGIARPGGPDLPRTHSGWRSGLRDLDRAGYDIDRSPLLERLLAEAEGEPLVVESEDGSPLGYALARRGRTATYIGPLIATSPSTAESLLDGMLVRHAGGEVCLDLHRGGLLAPDVLADRGLAKWRDLLRMACGARSDVGSAQSICASTGPEFG